MGLCEGPDGPRVKPIMETCSMFAKIFATAFTIEMILKIIAGGAEFFSECWHIVDLVVVMTNLIVEFFVHGLVHSGGLAAEEASQMLLIVRLWRLVKFCNLVREEHEVLLHGT